MSNVDVLEQDTFEIFCLIWFLRNGFALINKILPKIPILLLDFLDLQGRDHVRTGSPPNPNSGCPEIQPNTTNSGGPNNRYTKV